MSDKLKISKIKKGDWIELYPFGLTAGVDIERPVMIFKDKSEKYSLPIWLTGQEANRVIGESQSVHNSAHTLTLNIFKSINLDVKSCYFTHRKSHYQMMELHFEGSNKLKKLSAKANDSISLALASSASFFTTLENLKTGLQMPDAPEVNHSALGQLMADDVRPRYLN